jgi:cobalt/nickel transport protein
MKKEIIVVAIIVMAFMFQGHAFAHYGMVIPSDSMVMQKDSKMISLRVSFSHDWKMK